MRISDWSSDVCSSDLNAGHYTGRGQNDFAAFRDRDFFDRRDFDDGHMLSSMIALGNSQLRRCRPYAALRFGIEFAACSSCSSPRGTMSTGAAGASPEIGRAHVCTPVTNAHLVCRLLLEKKKRDIKHDDTATHH